MKISLTIISLVIFFLLNMSYLFAQKNYYDEGVNLFNKKKYLESKVKFEKAIVYNPKSERSYLFLAKIYQNNKNKSEEEKNLNTVLLLNPKNEEAIYLLTLLEIEKSNFSKAKDLIYKLDSVCEKFCASKKELEEKLNNSLSK
jgi:tetratricopeptide (TPR) repeat protein